MSAAGRGTCPFDGKSRFTFDEAQERVRKAKLRGKKMQLYRCVTHCGGWWHIAHAGDASAGGGMRRTKRRRPSRRARRARDTMNRGL